MDDDTLCYRAVLCLANTSQADLMGNLKVKSFLSGMEFVEIFDRFVLRVKAQGVEWLTLFSRLSHFVGALSSFMMGDSVWGL